MKKLRIFNIDVDLLLKQKEEIFQQVSNGKVVSNETLEGALNVLDEVQDIQDSFSHCLECEYIGNAGIWEGKVHFEDGESQDIKEVVYHYGDGTFNLDPIIKKFEKEVDNIDGEAFCPICGSQAFQ